MNMKPFRIGLAVALLVGMFGGPHLLDLPYEYYILLRWILCIGSLFLLYHRKDIEPKEWLGVYVVATVIFNPVHPIYTEREVWTWIDYILSILFLVSIRNDKKYTIEFKDPE